MRLNTNIELSLEKKWRPVRVIRDLKCGYCKRLYRKKDRLNIMAATVTTYSRVLSSKLLQVKSPGKLKIVLFWFTCGNTIFRKHLLKVQSIIVDLVSVY